MIDETTKRKGRTGSAGRASTSRRPKNLLVPMTLVTLGEGTSYGYELMIGWQLQGSAIRTRGRSTGHGGGWREKGPASPSGIPRRRPAPRRMYSVTGAWEAYLDSWAQGCELYQRVVDRFFLTYAAR